MSSDINFACVNFYCERKSSTDTIAIRLVLHLKWSPVRWQSASNHTLVANKLLLAAFAFDIFMLSRSLSLSADIISVWMCLGVEVSSVSYFTFKHVSRAHVACCTYAHTHAQTNTHANTHFNKVCTNTYVIAPFLCAVWCLTHTREPIYVFVHTYYVHSYKDIREECGIKSVHQLVIFD